MASARISKQDGYIDHPAFRTNVKITPAMWQELVTDIIVGIGSFYLSFLPKRWSEPAASPQKEQVYRSESILRLQAEQEREIEELIASNNERRANEYEKQQLQKFVQRFQQQQQSAAATSIQYLKGDIYGNVYLAKK